MKNLYYLLPFLFFLSSCFCDPPQEVYLPPIPDSLKNLIPYADGSIYTFQHSNGVDIQYKTTRNVAIEESWCEFCCDYIFHYEVLTVNLVPDYNLPTLNFRLYSPDSVYYYFEMYSSYSNFEIPVKLKAPEAYDFYTLLDTFSLNGIEYYNVFGIKAMTFDNNNTQVFYDSLYYNYSHGIIKLKTNYEEYYTIKP